MKAKILYLLTSNCLRCLEFDIPIQLSNCNISSVSIDGFDIEECGDPHADCGYYENLDDDDLDELAEAVEQQILSNEKAYKRAGLYD